MVIPTLVAATALAVNFANLSYNRTNLQSATDAAALMAAGQFSVAGTKRVNLKTIVASYIEENGPEGAGLSNLRVDRSDFSVHVEATVPAKPLLPFGPAQSEVRASATAIATFPGNLCALALASGAPQALHFGPGSRVTGPDCGAHANSSNRQAVAVGTGSNLVLAWLCSSGGLANRSLFRETILDCPTVPDPLSEIAQPEAGACDYTDPVIVAKGRVTLRPGVYCGGIRVTWSGHAHFEPGLYTIKDSAFVVRDNASATGRDMTLYFYGREARLNLRDNAHVDIAAPRTGPQAGILLMQQRMCMDTDRRCSDMYEGQWETVDEIVDAMDTQGSDLSSMCAGGRLGGLIAEADDDLCREVEDEVEGDDPDSADDENDDRSQDKKGNKRRYAEVLGLPGMFRIEANRVERLLGTIYLPSANLLIDANAPVAERSEYTAIISRKLTLLNGPDLHLNADYAATHVPVPKGIGPVADVRLVN